MDEQALERARQMCLRMTDAEIRAEYLKGKDAMRAEGWAALEREFTRRGLRIKPWRDQNLVLLTTAPSVDGYRVSRTLDIVSAECVLGLNFLRDFLAGLTDAFGGRSLTTQQGLRQAKETCLRELRNEAANLGADAVIAVTMDYNEFSGQGKSMLFLVASGTAVHLDRANTSASS
jgi:uncharacterized protein YbjQ (UPF0145 family)